MFFSFSDKYSRFFHSEEVEELERIEKLEELKELEELSLRFASLGVTADTLVYDTVMPLQEYWL